MSKARQVERTVIIPDRDMAFPGFLDMLRYDGCTVVSWGRLEHGSFEVTLRSAPGRTRGFEFTVERWRSFGIAIGEASPAPTY